jgi:hypothetical protein
MPRVRFEPTTPAFEWAKIVHALDRAVTVIGINYSATFSVVPNHRYEFAAICHLPRGSLKQAKKQSVHSTELRGVVSSTRSRTLAEKCNSYRRD